MKAIIKKNNQVVLTNLKKPLLKDNHSIVKISHVGICRTDLYVAKNLIKTKNNLILGHEASGTVIESKNQHLLNQPVAINPFYDQGFMGLNFNGALAEYVLVPDQQLIVCKKIDSKYAAYLEPLAASMAVLKYKKQLKGRGAIYGNNRIAQLTKIILNSYDINVDIIDENSKTIKTYDFIIETKFNTDSINNILNLLKPNGILIIKSRNIDGALFNSSILVKKEISIFCVNYYDFLKTKKWLLKNHQKITHLLGDSYPLEKWQEAFKMSEKNETKKIFIEF